MRLRNIPPLRGLCKDEVLRLRQAVSRLEQEKSCLVRRNELVEAELERLNVQAHERLMARVRDPVAVYPAPAHAHRVTDGADSCYAASQRPAALLCVPGILPVRCHVSVAGLGCVLLHKVVHRVRAWPHNRISLGGAAHLLCLNRSHRSSARMLPSVDPHPVPRNLGRPNFAALPAVSPASTPTLRRKNAQAYNSASPSPHPDAFPRLVQTSDLVETPFSASRFPRAPLCGGGSFFGKVFEFHPMHGKGNIMCCEEDNTEAFKIEHDEGRRHKLICLHEEKEEEVEATVEDIRG